ncbi:FixH family protein [Corallococcus sp. bb12-1]|uniref:FixH family protein n=1 Tax=Corallococcus sp. bb12-1 TaxID=2996784 RepID=UPI00226F2E61|nr:FixH family protein [Corallococcus sp. bb12-1]MCY1043724.1 FixH family protein [Corallococcus sp. bb12-1]
MTMWWVWMMLLGAVPPTPTAGSDAGTVNTELLVGTATSASGRLRVEVRSSAPSLKRGVQVFHVRVTEVATGKPIPGGTLSVQPWMPAMGHGISDTPRITERGPGDFEVAELDLFMPGAWELRFTLKDTVEDTAVVAFKLGR